ncbi:MAG: toxin-antitoxin system HicB family antitoxin [Pyramidobacter sp.]|nr:toxin-antitoxin system HicB family antitoxin [Pyramidobacter sp.]
MKEKLPQEILDRIAEIEARPPVELTEEDERSLAQAEAMNDGTTISHDELFSELEERDRQEEIQKCSAQLTIQIPRSLHYKLKEEALREGVSLNQYALYKLAL